MRPKQGYRYGNDLKRLLVYNRIMSGPLAYKSLQLNLPGCFPSTSTLNRYIHRSDHAIIEGQLRVEELLIYLKERNESLWVSLSEDATRVENKIQYDSRTNQLIGYVLPINKANGMPIPFYYKARSADEMLKYLCSEEPVAHFANTIMAQPFGGAAPFCLAVFGSNNQYRSVDVSRRWCHISEELQKVGIGTLTWSSDSDPKYNAAMRMNSNLGNDSKQLSMNGVFKCGTKIGPPFQEQDHDHIDTKAINLLRKTNDIPEKLPFGLYFISIEHLRTLLSVQRKDKHLLTVADLNNSDKQNCRSAQKICDEKVRNLLKKYVKDSDATATFLKVISDVTGSFKDKRLSPIDRLEKMWRSVFLVRIWRSFLLNHEKFTLKDNFMSPNLYYCIELNAHSLIFILMYVKKNNLTHLFLPYLLSSQPCEAFYRNVRSLTSTNSTVVNFTTKEILYRISRVQLLNEISNDAEPGFIFPKSLSSTRGHSHTTYSEIDFPTDDMIIRTLQKCERLAIAEAKKIGLITKSTKSKESLCVCNVSPYVTKNEMEETSDYDSTDSESDWLDMNDQFTKNDEFRAYLTSASLKNFAKKFRNRNVPETSSYVEVFNDENRRYVFKKCSLCWLLGKEKQKCSSDRRYRVMTKVEVFKPYKHSIKKTKKTKK